MSFLINLLLPKTRYSLRQRQQEKVRLERLSVYYIDKIDYLSGGRLNSRLAVYACRDAQVECRKTMSKGAEQSYVQNCIRYYKKKLRNINKELKKI